MTKMRLSLFMLFTILSGVLCKNHLKSLTESLGQEVIEIGPPIKELPPGLEEEPSAENDQDDKTTTTIQPATRRDSKKTTTITTLKKDLGVQSSTVEDEEAKIEKELAEMYKDSSDYKADSSEVTNEVTTTIDTSEDKPIARQRNFKFQPDLNNRADIEKFRTSVDEISCDRRVTKQLSGPQEVTNNAEAVLNISYFVTHLAICFLLSSIL